MVVVLDNVGHCLIPALISSSVEIFVRWLPPPEGWIQLNTDGASKGNPGQAGGGGILRDETGNFVSAFYFSCGMYSSMKSELLALLAGLEHAKSLNIKKLLIHMDNASSVDIIKEDQLTSNSLKFIVRRCKELVDESNWVTRIEHTYIQANRAADYLANRGVSSSTNVQFLQVPNADLRAILREDIFGVAIPRVITNN